MSNHRDCQLADPQGDQGLAVGVEERDQIPHRGELLIECPALEELLTIIRGPEWERTRIVETGHGTFTEDDALRHGIAGVTAALDLVRTGR